MRVVVTGGAGYIGSVISAQLVAAGHEVTVVDDLSTGHADAVPAGARFVRENIRQISGVFAELPTDAVIHCAAKSLVGESVANPQLYWHNNVEGTLALLDAMVEHGVGRIVFSSSAATYGAVSSEPIREDAPTNPTSPYGATKLAIDLALNDYATRYELSAVSLRYFNVAGALLTESQTFSERHATETHLIPNALGAASGSGNKLNLFGTDYPTPDGTCVRDYIHVVDIGRAHLLALEAATGHQVINLGSARGASVREVLAAVEEVTGLPVPVIESGRRAGDPPVLVASVQRAREVLGWQAELDLTTMVRDAWAARGATAE